MGRTSTKASQESQRKQAPARTPEARENQLIALATDLVEQRLRKGTASSQETTHFLKLGSMKSQLEMEKLREENKLLQVKTEAIQSQKAVEEIYSKALKAMQTYSGHGGEIEDE